MTEKESMVIFSGIDAEKLDRKIVDIFGDLTIDKKLVRELRIRESRTIPGFVEEWLVSRFYTAGKEVTQVYQDITDFMYKHLPNKTEKELIKKRILDGDNVVLLDKFTARIDLGKGLGLVTIPSLDESNAYIDEAVLEAHQNLLSGGQWGAGRLRKRVEKNNRNVIELVEFNPMQSGRVNLDKIIEARQQFTTGEWIYLLVRTIGYEPSAYTARECHKLLLRVLPMVHKNINMMELAPKGTGKSFLYNNLSRYTWINSGGGLSQAQLFRNQTTREVGLLGKNDLLILDEGQSITFRGADDVHAQFKGYLEAGSYSIGGHQVTSECGLMILANIDIYNNQPKRDDYIYYLPEMFHDSALMDRFHGIIPGWEIPRFTTAHAAQGIGIKADIFGEYLHQLRAVSTYTFPFGHSPHLDGDMRDKRAVERLCMALSKLLMLNPDDQEYDTYIYQPACELRERVCTQLAAITPNEFLPRLRISRG